MKNRLESVTHSVKTRHKNEGSYLATPKVLALAVSSAMTVFACPSLLHAHSVTGPVSGSGIQWETVSADGDRTIRIQYPDGTRYYQYNYTGTPAYSSRQDLLTGNISGDFKGSSYSDTDPASPGSRGGALVNTGNLDKVSSNFLENTVHFDQSSQFALGGALHNEGNMNALSGQFVGNQANGGTTDTGAGGALSNKGQIGSVNSDFIGNFATGFDTRGGALFNDKDASIGKISGHFMANVSGGTYQNSGGAIYNLGTVGDINANFIGNVAALDSDTDGSANAVGGALYNKGIINSISGSVQGNHAYAFSSNGGAFYNDVGGAIHSIAGKFDGNYASSAVSTFGGAITNYGQIDRITGDFTRNHVTSDVSYDAEVYGGVIANLGKGTISSISGNFSQNDALSSYKANGGVLYNSSEGINSISGNFYNNSTISTGASSMGGAIFTTANIGNISGNFIGNQAQATGADSTSYARGGAIYLSTSRTSIRNNNSSWGQLEHAKNQEITNSLFQNNVASSEKGKAIGGAISNYVTYNAGAYVGAQQNQGTYEDSRLLEEFRLSLTNSSFIDNKATGVTAQGGAVYSNNHMEVVADNGVSVFRGNTANGQSSAIYIAKKTGNAFIDIIKSGRSIDSGGNIYPDELTNPPPPNKLYLTARNNGTISIYDDIDGDLGKDGAPGYKLIFGGDNTGSSNIIGKIHNADIYSGETENGSNHIANIADASVLSHLNNNLTLNSGTFNLARLGVNDDMHVNKLSLTSGSFTFGKQDVDLIRKKMGTISADTYVTGQATIDVRNLRPVNDSEAGINTRVHFIDPQISSQVINHVSTTYSPIYRYSVGYDPSVGDFSFYRPLNPGGSDYNPEVTVPGTANILLAALLNEEIYTRVLSDIDTYKSVKTGEKSDGWVKTFGSRDNVDFKGGYNRINANFSGVIGGISSGRIEGKDNWSRIFNLYGAYAHGEQDIHHGTIRQDIGYIGASAFSYRGNFFAGITGNLGFAHHKTSESLGKDTFNSYLAGFGIKTGYDLPVGNNMTLQPNLYGSWTYIKSDDYISKSDVRVQFGKMHVFEIAPGLKLTKEFDNKLKGSIQGRYVWTNTSSQNVVLDNSSIMPDIGIRPYAEYGIGLEKNTPDDKYSGYFHILRRDGGRSGWNVIFGGKMTF